MLTKERTTARARLASASARANRHPDDPAAHEAVAHARRDYHAVSIAEHVARAVADAPPLTPEQRDRIAVLLRPSAGGDAA